MPDTAPASEAAPAPKASRAEAATPPTPYAAAAKVVTAVHLRAVRFSAFSVQGFQTVDTIPDEADLNGTTSFLRPTVLTDARTFSAETTLVFRLVGKLPDPGLEATYAIIRATIHADYMLKTDVPEFTSEELTDFALCYCPFHVWGYWREFVQSSLARLDLPHATIPLFLIDQAMKIVRDDLDGPTSPAVRK